jgi:gamma-glutamyl phosphate reductase
VDEDADIDLAIKICYDSKCRILQQQMRWETLLVHKKIASVSFLNKRMFWMRLMSMLGDDAT